MREFIRHQLFLFKQERTGHLGSTKTGGQIQAQAHTVTATTPVQLTTLLSMNSVINYPHKIQFIMLTMVLNKQNILKLAELNSLYKTGQL